MFVFAFVVLTVNEFLANMLRRSGARSLGYAPRVVASWVISCNSNFRLLSFDSSEARSVVLRARYSDLPRFLSSLELVTPFVLKIGVRFSSKVVLLVRSGAVISLLLRDITIDHSR